MPKSPIPVPFIPPNPRPRHSLILFPPRFLSEGYNNIKKNYPDLTYIRYVLLTQEIIEEILALRFRNKMGPHIISSLNFLLDFCSESITQGVYCLWQEIFVEILRGNKALSRIRRDKPLFPHSISSLISIRRI